MSTRNGNDPDNNDEENGQQAEEEEEAQQQPKSCPTKITMKENGDDDVRQQRRRPFLSYSTFKKMSQDGEAAAADFAMENGFHVDGNGTLGLQQRHNTICRLIKRFADGRVWIEMGGHELLLRNPMMNSGDDGADDVESTAATTTNQWGNGHDNTATVGSICPAPLTSSLINAAFGGSVGATHHHHNNNNNHLSSCIFANYNNNKASPPASSNHNNHNGNGRMMRPLISSMSAHPERMPFDDFCRQFRCLLDADNAGQGKSFVVEEETARERARRILQHANVPEHRYRLGLSQILLQSETLVHLEGMRTARLTPLITAFQAHCRHNLMCKQLITKRAHFEAALIIQENLQQWQERNRWPWWQLFQHIRPLIPIASLEQKERQWRDQLAHLESELDDMRSQLSCAQLELESTRKAKAMADEWGEQQQRMGVELRAQVEKARAECGEWAKQLEAATCAAHEEMCAQQHDTGWEQHEKTMDIKRELHDALDRAHCAEQKAQQATLQLNDVQSEVEEMRNKNERMEKRLKSAQEELSSVREQLDSMEEANGQLQRQLHECGQRETRKAREVRNELEAKEAEMDTFRIKSQRQIRELESQLDQAKQEISTLHKQKLAWQTRGSSGGGGSGIHALGSSASSICDGSMSDLAQSNSLLNTNRALKRKLSKALTLLNMHSAHAQLASGSVEKNALVRMLRQQLESVEASELHARRAQLTAENEMTQLKSQLNTAICARQNAEQKLALAVHEKNAATAFARDHEEQLKDALKRERCLVERLGLEQIQLRTLLEQIAQLERELRNYKTGLRRADGELAMQAGLNANLVERQKLELLELKMRDLNAELDMEMAQRRHVEVLLNQAKDDIVCGQQQLQDANAARDKEIEAHKQLKRDNLALEQKLNETSRREADMATKHKATKLECIRLDEELRSYVADLKMANKRMEILQAAFTGASGESHHANVGTIGAIGIHSISSMSGGSELGDLDEMLLGEEEEEEGAMVLTTPDGGGMLLMERASATKIHHTQIAAATGTTTQRDSPEFDGANSDTAEGSSSASNGGEEHSNAS